MTLRQDYLRYLVLAALTIFALVMLVPFVIVTMNALKSPAEYAGDGPLSLPDGLYLQGLIDFWHRVDYGQKLLNSLLISGSVAILAVIVSTLNAYALGIGRVKGRTWLLIVFLMANTLPHEALVYPLYYLSKEVGLYDTRLAIVLIFVVIQTAFGTYLLSAVLSSFPREVLEAAQMDGAGYFRAWWSVILPQSWAVIVAVAVFHVVYTWNLFFEPLLYLSSKPELQPIATGLAQFNSIYSERVELVQAATLMTIIVPMLLFFACQRFFMRGIVITGVEK
jgi:raffinose/stachyose/melibiose transport system permease protein